MILAKAGELAALATAVFWTVTAVCFEYAGKRVGTFSLNLLRLIVGFLFLGFFSLFTRGFFLPLDAGADAWFWLSLSGLVGFVVGDLLLFQAFILIGARISMLIYASVPPLTAVLAWLVFGEIPTPAGLAGMAVTVTGIALVVLQTRQDGEGKRELAHPVGGVLFALGGSLGQAGGLIMSKIGAPSYNAFSATQIRVIAGIAGFTAVVAVLGRFPRFLAALKDRKAMGSLSLGAFFGPFLGVSLGLVAVQRTSAGVASTIMAITPVLIIIPSVLFFHEKIRFREILGALVAVSGVALLFLA